MAVFMPPAPTPEELLSDVAQWIATTFRIKVTVSTDHEHGYTRHEMSFDGRMPPPKDEP